MGKTQDEAQEIVLRQMEKVNRSEKRKGERTEEDQSLEAQLKRAAEYDKLTIEQKRARVPKRDWEDALLKYAVKEKNLCTNTSLKSLLYKRKDKFDEFHKAGANFADIVPYIQEELRKLY